VSAGSVEENVEAFAEAGLLDVAVDAPEAIFNAYRLEATPSAIAIDRSGRIASAPAGGLHMPEVVMRIAVRGELDDVPEREREPLAVLKFGSQAV